MSLKAALKLAIIGFLGLLLCIALIAVRETVSERSELRKKVHEDIAESIAAAQILAGPILVLPYEIQSIASEGDEKASKNMPSPTVRQAQFILPRHLKIDGNLKAESRFRSLYEILVYGTQLRLEGDFEFSEPKTQDVPLGMAVRWLQPYLVVLLKDNRGISSIPLLTWNGENLQVKPGHAGLNRGIEGGFHSDLPSQVHTGGRFTFAVDLALRGTESLSWVPVGEETQIILQANWPHPSFQGRALPKNHQIKRDGFTAEWEATHFSSNIVQLLSDEASGSSLKGQEFGVRLIQPVDVYLQTERSVKYGFLFIALTFAAFLLFETLKRLSIHPVQYALVGLALVVFYVLLLALSEHLSFAMAYFMASLASISLLCFYLRYIVLSWKTSLLFGSSLALLNAIVYGILQSEDFALLYGSCLLFALLAGAMIVTRRVKWDQLDLSGEK